MKLISTKKAMISSNDILFFFLYLVLFPNEIVSLHFIGESLIQISETILFIEIFN